MSSRANRYRSGGPGPVLGVLFLALVLILGGCGDDDPSRPAVQPVYPLTPDDLVQELAAAFGQMDDLFLAMLLDPGFTLYYDQLDWVGGKDLPPNELDRATFLQLARLLFSGTPLPGPDGLLPGVTGIEMRLEPLDDWQNRNTEPFPGSTRRLFRMEMILHTGNTAPRLVEDRLELFASSRTAVTDGSEIDYWQIRALVQRVPPGAAPRSRR
jgi:hypothetical protein